MKKFKVGGMSCAACSARVEKAVCALDGVDSCAVNLLTGSMSVEGGISDEEIIEAVTAAGYSASVSGATATNPKDDALVDRETPKLVKRLLTSLAFLIVLMYFSMGHMLGLPLPSALKENAMAQGLIQLLLSGVILIINQKFFISGAKALVKRAPNMDTLVALGSFVSFAYSVYGIFKMSFRPEAAREYLHELYFESAAMILVLITVGKMLESLAKGKTTSAIKALMNLSPKTATVIKDGKELVIPVDEVVVGDVFIVRPGESVAVDGSVIEGESAIDESALTGESIPSEKSVGSKVYAATVNRSGFLKCRAESVGEGTAIAGIIKMVSDASATKAPIAKIADKVSGVFVPFVLAVALITTAVWLFVGEGIGFALARGISVLVISCPCALGLATPVAIMVGSGVGARNGILFKNATAIELAGKVKNVVLDKTGTVTEGRPRVTKIVPFDMEEAELLRLCSAAEKMSEHPLAVAVTDAAKEMGIEIPDPSDFEAVAGGGVRATVEGRSIQGGSLKFVSSTTALSESAEHTYTELAKEGNTPLIFLIDGKVTGIIAVRDTVKPDSKAAVSEMKRMGLSVTMLTGDNELSAKEVAREVGVDRVVAGVMPEGKEAVIRELSESGTVMMVGDGINDAPALARADVGVAIGRGTDVAIDSADVVLKNSNLSDAASVVRLGRAVLRNIKQNLFWAFCYNVIGIPLAAGAFIALLGWEMNPMFGAAAMSISSFLVVMNALRLNLFKAHPHSTVKDICRDCEKGRDERIFSVKGMMCAHCEGRVRDALLKIEGVTEALADHKKGIVTVSAPDTVTDETIKTAIREAGYEVK